MSICRIEVLGEVEAGDLFGEGGPKDLELVDEDADAGLGEASWIDFCSRDCIDLKAVREPMVRTVGRISSISQLVLSISTL